MFLKTPINKGFKECLVPQYGKVYMIRIMF